MTLENLVERLQKLEHELDDFIDEGRQQFHYTVKQKRVRFEQAIRERHRKLRVSSFRFLVQSGFLAVLFSPIVYSLMIPLVLLDLFVSFFQMVCFPVYGMEKVKRADFIAIDRHQLAYLNWIEKLNCVYCSYANGLLAYTRAIAGRAEEHWCPIKHARRLQGRQMEYWDFADYGDAESFRNKESRVLEQHTSRIAKKWIETETEDDSDSKKADL
jgi:hypothetical protein